MACTAPANKPAPLKIGMLLPKVLNLKIAAVNKAFAPLGLTHSAWVVLHSIARHPGQSTHALAESCLVTDQAFGQLVAKLAAQGLVERRPGFGKAILHELTGPGKKLLAVANPLLETTLRRLFAPLDGKEQETLATLLERILMPDIDAKPTPARPRRRSPPARKRTP